jgi:hypothetical protein
MSEKIIQLKKRGRKPKNKLVENNIKDSPINSDQEAIIVHLPVSLDDVVNIESTYCDDVKSEENNIFIKSESDFTNIKFKEEINIKSKKQEETITKEKTMTEEELQNFPQMMFSKMAAQQQLINLLYSQVMDLTMMSKIELGDDVIDEIKRLKSIIK